MICFCLQFFYHIERFFWRCLINETEFWWSISKECATATLRESLATRLYMSGGPSTSPRSSATPVTFREAAENTNRTNELCCSSSGAMVTAHQKTRPRNLTVSMRKIAPETGTTGESVHRIATQELHLKPHKLQMVLLLTPDNKRVRLERCRRLHRLVTPLNWEPILFTDEKLFTIGQAHKHQDERSWWAEALGTSTILEQPYGLQHLVNFEGQDQCYAPQKN